MSVKHTTSYVMTYDVLIVCSLDHIAYDIVGHYRDILCPMLTLYVLCTTSYAISHMMSHTMFHLIQNVRAKLPACALWDSIEQTSFFYCHAQHALYAWDPATAADATSPAPAAADATSPASAAATAALPAGAPSAKRASAALTAATLSAAPASSSSP
jgi:hypothetical protein